LLHYTLTCAQQFSQLVGADIQLSTDSEEIIECASDLGYETKYRRPIAMAQDSSGKMEAIREAWKYAEENNQKEYDYVLDLDVTSPLRTLSDLKDGLSIIQSNRNALNLFSVNRASRNPYFNMVEQNDNGYYRLIKNMGEVKSRQSAPRVYDMNASFYYYTREYLLGDYSMATTERSIIYEMPHICFDLDEPLDFTVLELMLKNNLLDFEIC
jgi:CMP-N,N'-diacetyllegionaminic acid synthase